MPNEKIYWNSEEYSLGIDTIDSQHKKLFILVNKLYDLDDDTATKEEIRSILYDFSNYMKTHFNEEEEFMQSVGYDLIQEHKQQHEELIEILHSVIKIPAKLNIIKSKMKIIAKRALINHIIREDMKIKEFLVKNHIDFKYYTIDLTNLEIEN